MTAMRRTMSLRSQLLLLQVAIVVLTIGIVGGVAVKMQSAQIRDSYEERMIGVARSVATLPSVRDAYSDPAPAATIQPIAEMIRAASGVTYVVVTDTEGIRYSHPDPRRIGEHVSTDPSETLAGQTYVGTQTGTLGQSWRVKMPIRSEGEVIGMVSVGTLEATLRSDLLDDLPQLLLWVLGAGLVGTLGAVYVTRLVWRRIYQMEPEEIASLREVRDAMLHGLGEGVVALDEHGRVALVNDEARRLLDLPEDVVGSEARTVLDGALHDLLGSGGGAADRLVLVGEQILFARADRAVVDGRDVGAVLLLRDRTEVQALVRDLDGERDLTQALRAQAHEFANTMHVVGGLLDLGRHEDARTFITRTGGTGGPGRYAELPGITDPAVAALLLAKTATAHERGVLVQVAPGATLAPDGTTDAVTVLGNLVDNGVDATGRGGTVLVELAQQGATSLLRVTDDGPGVAAADRERVFTSGFSTKAGPRTHGIGLALVHHVVTRRGGSVELTEAPGGGACFTVRLPAPRIAAAPPALVAAGGGPA